jgi:hypothetical protein
MLLQFFSAKNVGSEIGNLFLNLKLQNALVHFTDVKKGTWEVRNMTMHVTIIPFLIQFSVLSLPLPLPLSPPLPLMFKGQPVMFV